MFGRQNEKRRRNPVKDHVGGLNSDTAPDFRLERG